MSERIPIQHNLNDEQLPCEEWEALLADALDGTLAEKDRAVFTAHGKDCPLCAEMLAQAKQGQQWMAYLQEEPSAPANLVEKILSRTSGASLPQLAAQAAVAQPVLAPVVQFKMRNSFRDARILMTAAMAFFSIMLTLNMVGIRFNSLRMEDLKPSSLQGNFTRQFYRARQQMVSSYENLRLVYVVETKMRELRQDADQQKQQPRKDEKPQGAAPNGSGHSIAPVLCGEPVQAGLKSIEQEDWAVNEQADQAERSLA